MFFCGSGRYREQLKLLYKVHKVFCRRVFFFFFQRHGDTELFFGCGRYREQLTPLLQRTQSFSAATQVPLGGFRGAGGFYFSTSLHCLMNLFHVAVGDGRSGASAGMGIAYPS